MATDFDDIITEIRNGDYSNVFCNKCREEDMKANLPFYY